MPSLQSSSGSATPMHSPSHDRDFMFNAPPAHTLQFNYPSPEPSPTPGPSPTPSDFDALQLWQMHATIFPDDTFSNRSSSTSRSPNPRKPRHFSLSPPRNPNSYWGFESPQRSIPKCSRSTKPLRASPAPTRAPFTQKIPSFSAARHNASVLAGCHATGSTRLEKGEQLARKEIDQLLRLPGSQAATLFSDYLQCGSATKDKEENYRTEMAKFCICLDSEEDTPM